ncbi:MAG: DUF2238 domain-containing protein [Comamonadaceae bacterium]|nr:MAG: DUF2238 domain-containing protein [Comamonadaceae bacterium]
MGGRSGARPADGTGRDARGAFASRSDAAAPGFWLLLASVGAALVVSSIAPADRLTWLLESAPLAVVLPLLWCTRHRFPLTPLLYLGITVQCLGLIAGATYTFPRVPLGEWIAQWLDLSRNPYDRIGHFVQGLVPALAVREMLVRIARLRGRRLLPFVTACVVMTFSATYEIVEWLAAVTLGADAEDFLGMQGDPWDAQADMACAFAGAVCMLLMLPRLHDRQIARIGAERPATPNPVRSH